MKNIATLIIAVLFFSSCQTYHYYPTYQAIPTNQKKNEVASSSFVSNESIGQSVSYSITDHFGAFVTHNKFVSYGDAYISDIGAYYYKPLKSIEENSKMTLAMSGAYSFGSRHRSDTYNLKLRRLYLQPSFGYESKFVDFGFSVRLAQLNYEFDLLDTKNKNYYSLGDLGKKPFYFFEPNMFIGIGYKWIKINYSVEVLNKLNNSDLKYYKKAVSYLSLSLKYDLDKLLRKGLK